MSLEAGTKLGRYEIRSKIGAGGMGDVYLAQDTELDRTVAVKILPDDVTGDEQRLHRFTQEARAVSALNHPNILTIHEIGSSENIRFIATEFIDGQTLRRSIESGLKLIDILEIAIQAGSALAAAHAAGIIHRDIKPDNIMVRRDGYVKLLDFGLAKLIVSDSSTDAEAETLAMINTSAGAVIGTAKYMSPEQAKGIAVDRRTDLWSLGAVIYEMITRNEPFGGETPTEIISLILQREPPPLDSYVNEAPPELQRIVSKALTKKLDDRYQAAEELVADLRNLKRKLEATAETSGVMPELRRSTSDSSRLVGPLTATRETPATALPAPSSAEYVVSGIKQHKRAAIVTSLVVFFGLVGLVILLQRSRNSGAAIQSIAVLPFENQSQDPETEYLSDGVTESIINSLAQLPNVRVIARSSVFRYKGQKIDPLKAGQELGVHAVLTGRLVQRGDSLTISTELLDVRENKQLWGEQYNEKVADILSMQRAIAGQISNHLRLKLSGSDQSRVTRVYTQNTDAYQLYLKGRFLWNKRTSESLEKSVEYFDQAIAKDPTYALAYAGLADSWYSRGWYRYVEPKQAYEKARVAANRALELDPRLAEGHAILAAIKTVYDWDWAGAEREFKLAIELNPSYATAHQRYSLFLPALGRFDEAIAEARKARDVDPLALPVNENLGDILYLARRYDEAIEQLRKTLELDPNYGVAHGTLAKVYEAQGKHEELLEERLKGSSPETVAELRKVFAASGIKGVWQNRLNVLLERSKTAYVSPADIALFYTRLNDRDQAFAWLEKAMAERSINFNYLVADPRFDNLRGDPRLAALLRRVGLEPIKI
ncbi:MAG TPA: protein kinase [Pyrinomonadaceae bacterium]|nr:protein kinase [Pyrinomonadaceae bacterium]